MSDTPLLDWKPEAPARRKVANSVAAAASLGEALTPQCIAALKAIRACGEHGAIRDDVERLACLKTPAACGRLNWLESFAFIDAETPGRPGASGRNQKIYRLTSRGLRQLAQIENWAI